MRKGRKRKYNWSELKVGDTIEIVLGDKSYKNVMATVHSSVNYYNRTNKPISVTTEKGDGVVIVKRVKI